MRIYPFLFLGLVSLLLGFSGCEPFKEVIGIGPKKTPLPIVFATTPSLDEVKSVLNGRYASINSLSSKNARLSMSGFSLNACSIAYEKPNRLRVRGGIAVGLGTEVDFGCNGEHLWLWSKSNKEKELYYARLDQFANCPAKEMMRIEPEWLLESIGLLELKPTDNHTAPERSPEGNLLVKSELHTSGGKFIRVLTIHPQTSALLQHEIYDTYGRQYMVSRLSEHTVDAQSGILYAKKVEVYMAKTGEQFSISLGSVEFNSPSGFGSDTFQIPEYRDYVPTDICGPDFLQRFQMDGRGFTDLTQQPQPILQSTEVQPTHGSYPPNPGYTPEPGQYARPFMSERQRLDASPQENHSSSTTNTTYVRPLAF